MTYFQGLLIPAGIVGLFALWIYGYSEREGGGGFSVWPRTESEGSGVLLRLLLDALVAAVVAVYSGGDELAGAVGLAAWLLALVGSMAFRRKNPELSFVAWLVLAGVPLVLLLFPMVVE